MWDPDTRPSTLLTGRTDKVVSVDWSPDGHLVSSSADGTVRLGNRSTGTSTALTGHRGWVWSAAWSGSGGSRTHGSVRLQAAGPLRASA
ncbi:hypothetical protein AB9Q10_24955 [Streptomyces krungchingensis]|uniref:hypothetical protein n=1 Tax=Streptomyces krungchingensis TaxID=1565034 RepID=UPI003CF901CB